MYWGRMLLILLMLHFMDGKQRLWTILASCSWEGAPFHLGGVLRHWKVVPMSARGVQNSIAPTMMKSDTLGDSCCSDLRLNGRQTLKLKKTTPFMISGSISRPRTARPLYVVCLWQTSEGPAPPSTPPRLLNPPLHTSS